jgi:zinc D-Ala-D-Ala dipeptidase
MSFISIGDEKIIEMKSCESKEKIVDLNEYGFLVDLERKQILNRSPFFSYVRESVANRLIEAQKRLPKNICFYIKEGYRPLAQQKRSYTNVFKHIESTNPTFTYDQIVQETNLMCAPVEVAPHPTGAAVDLTLINLETNKELNMGTLYNAVPLETNNATFLNAENIEDQALRNRNILKEAMTDTGLVCYPAEWWHWSYGDKYWAYIQGQKQALYESINEEHINLYMN